MVDAEYAQRLAQEVDRYRTVSDVHDLPDIFHYWAERYLMPKLHAVGIQSLDDFYSEPVLDFCRENSSDTIRVASLGSGNGDTEARLAQRVLAAGQQNFEVTCVEINASMQARAFENARGVGAEQRLRFDARDLNSWTADCRYHVVMASHSLHHVVELEHLFREVRSSLVDDGYFLVNDMVGRNGHQRWPEALSLIQLLWRSAPARYKYNRQLLVLDDEYVNRDYSMEGFEGIRAQDVLPLLLRTFFPDRFISFGNLTSVLTDRGYGHNFDPNSDEDRAFIDRVAQLDDLAIDLGVIKPTQLIASFRTKPVEPRFFGNRAPDFSVRDPDVEVALDSEWTRLQADLAGVRAEHARMLSSKSWRYTLPMRALLVASKRAYGRLNRVARRH
ncbi:MAG: class I SAM-dependent methyltransferase [Candidatus Dormibacteraeota bacterium]|uniref:Class I SAM-dependent methyltransferase n=1 Tax=Candidatus Amunia macphersoniae TaxID=3127014 RepID=A0A934KED3_9BACT|nr:class I SAM-dependent methyltransferase [Candidatus Dormibacteraeota bacterium]